LKSGLEESFRSGQEEMNAPVKWHTIITLLDILFISHDRLYMRQIPRVLGY